MNAVKLSRLVMLIIFSEDLDPNIVSLRTILFAMITWTASDTLRNRFFICAMDQTPTFLNAIRLQAGPTRHTVKREVLLSNQKHDLKAQQSPYFTDPAYMLARG